MILYLASNIVKVISFKAFQAFLMYNLLQVESFLWKNLAALDWAMNCHCLTLEPRMTCFAYLLVFVVHITNPHECIVTLQMKCKSCLRLRIHLSGPLAYLQSIVSMPKTKPRYCWNTRITLDRMILHVNTHLKQKVHFTNSIFFYKCLSFKSFNNMTLDIPLNL